MSSVESRFESAHLTQYVQESNSFKRRLAVAGVAMCALAVSAVDPAAAQKKQESIVLVGELPQTPHLAVGLGDDASLKNNYLDRRELSLQKGREISATWQRTIVYPAEYKEPEGKAKVHTALQSIKTAGYKSVVTLGMNGEATPDAFRGFAMEFMTDMEGLGVNIDALILGNEVNYPWDVSGGLVAMPGLSQAATFSHIYRAAYRTLKDAYPDLVIGAADLGAVNGTKAIDFLREAAENCPKPANRAMVSATCGPLLMDLLGIHPYTKYSPHKPDPNGGLRMGSLIGFENDLTKLHTEGLVRTESTNVRQQRPRTMITEMGFMGGATGDLANKNLGAVSRRRFTRRTLSVACKDPYLMAIIFHQPFYKPDFWGGHWNTPIWNIIGEDLGPATAIKQFVNSPLRQDCIQQPDVSLTAVQYTDGKQSAQKQKPAKKNQLQNTATREVLRRSRGPHQRSQARRASHARNHVVQARV